MREEQSPLAVKTLKMESQMGSNISPMSKLDKNSPTRYSKVRGSPIKQPGFALNLKLTEDDPFTPSTPKIIDKNKPALQD
jgi:hypothetical protein